MIDVLLSFVVFAFIPSFFSFTKAFNKVVDALYVGLGSHYIPAEKQPELLKALKALKHKTPEHIDGLIQEAVEIAPESSLKKQEDEINELFSAETLAGIFANLEGASSGFAKEALEVLKKRSPTSLAVTFEQLKRGKDIAKFADIMSMEFDLSQNFVKKSDFMEGIRAAVVDKDCTPKWSPESLEGVSADDIEGYFAKHPRPLFSL